MTTRLSVFIMKEFLKNSEISNSYFRNMLECERICKVGMMVRLKKIAVPGAAKSVPLGQKRRRGRSPKSKPALIVQ